MYPTSVLLQKGHRIRVALAGAAATLFERYPALRNNQIGRRLTKFR
jgi:predicted acyl esterase